MDRRTFLGTLAASLLAAPLAAGAQQAGKRYRIGFLGLASPSDPRIQRWLAAFRDGLAELGYVEGRNIAIESRWAGGKYERLPDLAAELVSLKTDVIVTAAVPAIRAAKEATSTIPIIMAVVVDPVATGLVASLARPGGNITSLSIMTPDLVGKQLEMLREIAPKASRVAVLWNPANQGNPVQLRASELAARTLGLRLQPLEARSPHEIDAAFAAMTTERAAAVVVLVDAMFVDQRSRIADLAETRRLPAVYGLAEHVEAGGLTGCLRHPEGPVRRDPEVLRQLPRGRRPVADRNWRKVYLRVPRAPGMHLALKRLPSEGPPLEAELRRSNPRPIRS